MKLGILKSYKEIDTLIESYANACKEEGVFTFEKGDDFFKYNSNVLRVKDFVQKIGSGYYSNL